MDKKKPRYDLPNAAPEPLRFVQRFVNTIDLTHDREWLEAWLEEQGLTSPTDGDLGHARVLREAIRELLYANNGQGGPGADAEAKALSAAADAARLTIDFDEGRARAAGAGPRRHPRPRRGRLSRDDGRRHVAPPEVLPQRQLPLVVLRLLEEPLGHLVLDAALRQPDEDARVPPPHRPARCLTALSS